MERDQCDPGKKKGKRVMEHSVQLWMRTAWTQLAVFVYC